MKTDFDGRRELIFFYSLSYPIKLSVPAAMPLFIHMFYVNLAHFLDGFTYSPLSSVGILKEPIKIEMWQKSSQPLASAYQEISSGLDDWFLNNTPLHELFFQFIKSLYGHVNQQQLLG